MTKNTREEAALIAACTADVSRIDGRCVGYNEIARGLGVSLESAAAAYRVWRTLWFEPSWRVQPAWVLDAEVEARLRSGEV